MLRNLAASLITHGAVRTTDAKAKAVRPLVERLVTLGKRGDLHARRQALRFVSDKAAVHKLFTDLAERFEDRPGGYTRIIKIGERHGDAAPVSLIQFLGESPREPRRRAREGGDVAARTPASGSAAEAGG
jgi:large subunit ribosomal protein L17